MQRLAARRQHAEVGAALQQLLDHVADSVQHVLAVVDDQQRTFGAQRVDPQVSGQLAHLLRQPERRRDARRNQVRIAQRRELHQVHAVGEQLEKTPAGFKRQARLADAAEPGERDQPVFSQLARQRRELAFAAVEARQRQGQVVRDRAVGRPVERTQRREVVAQTLRDHLIGGLRMAEVLEPVQPQIAQ